MNVVDSSGWIEYMVGGPNAEFFADAIGKVGGLIVPTIVVTEVLRFLLRKTNEDQAVELAACMRQALVADLDFGMARAVARLGIEHKLPLADSIVFATAQAHGATLWTQDADFENIPGVRFIAKK